MKISTKGRYALRLMLDIALNGAGEPVSLRDVAHRQDISDKYLEQIITPLGRAGLVRSVRGAGGGYLLTRTPEEYTVGEILRLTEESLAPVSCLEKGTEACQRVPECRTLALWRGLDKIISEYLDGVTVADLLRPRPAGDNCISMKTV